MISKVPYSPSDLIPTHWLPHHLWAGSSGRALPIMAAVSSVLVARLGHYAGFRSGSSALVARYCPLPELFPLDISPLLSLF